MIDLFFLSILEMISINVFGWFDLAVLGFLFFAELCFYYLFFTNDSEFYFPIGVDSCGFTYGLTKD